MPRASQTPAPALAVDDRVPVGWYGAGLVGVFAACAASGMLVADRLGWLGRGLPGCGPNSGCAKATNSALGKLPFEIPGVGPWPVSFVGFAFFASMLGVWLVAGLFRGRRVPASVVHMSRLGVLASGFYLFVMLTHMNDYFCKYCAASHAANIAFWVSVEAGTRFARRRAPGFFGAVVTAGAVFLASNVGMGLLDVRAQAAAKQAQESDLAAEIAAMKADLESQQAAPPAGAPNAPAQQFPPIDIGIPVPPDDTLVKEGFTGRYRLGPAEAPIRVVVISDYQCKDCKKVEEELRQIVKDNPNVSLSAKHFPFDQSCNKNLDRTLHANACWAARAAETAGMLRGNAGFWQMHFWLFDRKTDGNPTPGSFTNPELEAGLRELGYDPAKFVEVMKSQAPLELVQKDIEEAMNLGIFSTPMVFVNGREFKSWQAPEAVKRYIQAVEQTGPKPAPATADRPIGAIEKAVEDWRQWPRVDLRRNQPSFTRGPENAKVRFVMFGDLREDFTARLLNVVDDVIKQRPGDVSFTFYPRTLKEACNVLNAKPEDQPACRMARAVEAAGRLGGNEAFWRMFDHLRGVGKNYSEASLTDAAKAAGLELEALKAEMAKDEVMYLLVENTKMFQRGGARGVPTLFVNERCILRWNVNNIPIVDRIAAAAAEGK